MCTDWQQRVAPRLAAPAACAAVLSEVVVTTYLATSGFRWIDNARDFCGDERGGVRLTQHDALRERIRDKATQELYHDRVMYGRIQEEPEKRLALPCALR